MDFLPKVSIVIPVYNGADFLKQAINSALAQTYSNTEILVVNDGSDDGGQTEKNALSYGDRIRYFAKKNGGVASALNVAIDKMAGDYFSWLSHDDLYYPDKVDSQIKALSGMSRQRTILYGDYAIFSEDPDIVKVVALPGVCPEHFRYFITVNNSLHGCTLLIPKAAFGECGVFNEGLRTTQDYDLWFRMAEKFSFVHIPHVLVKARQHAGQGILKMQDIALLECEKLLTGFVDSLSQKEMITAANKPISLSYAEISVSMAQRGYFKTARHATRLAMKNIDKGFTVNAVKTVSVLIITKVIYSQIGLLRSSFIWSRFIRPLKNMLLSFKLCMAEQLNADQKSVNSRNVSAKPVVLTLIGHYLPGHKAGGIVRSMVNAVENLCDDVEFWIVTRDRDLGDDKPYDNVKTNQWQPVGCAMVYYSSSQSSTLKSISKLIFSTKHDVLYLNSFFDTFTIKVLLNRKLNSIFFKPIIVAPRGEFAWASLKQKYLKKFVFIQVARLFGLYNNVIWHASSEFEKFDIGKVMKIKNDVIHTALDLPVKMITKDSDDLLCQPVNNCESLKVVFLSRISREKNLDYALKVLSKVKARVLFDIYGPAENPTYWKECRMLISQLPANVEVNYLGSVNPDQVLQIFSRYDLFLFPTGGENYGHVIAESLSAGTPVLISDRTPWRHLQNDNLGWDLTLDDMNSFVTVIEKQASMRDYDRSKKRALIKARVLERLIDPAVLEANRRLFKKLISKDKICN